MSSLLHSAAARTAEYLQPIQAAVCSVISSKLDLPIARTEMRSGAHRSESATSTAFLGIAGDVRGCLMLHASDRLLTELVVASGWNASQQECLAETIEGVADELIGQLDRGSSDRSPALVMSAEFAPPDWPEHIGTMTLGFGCDDVTFDVVFGFDK